MVGALRGQGTLCQKKRVSSFKKKKKKWGKKRERGPGFVNSWVEKKTGRRVGERVNTIFGSNPTTGKGGGGGGEEKTEIVLGTGDWTAKEKLEKKKRQGGDRRPGEHRFLYFRRQPHCLTFFHGRGNISPPPPPRGPRWIRGVGSARPPRGTGDSASAVFFWQLNGFGTAEKKKNQG